MYFAPVFRFSLLFHSSLFKIEVVTSIIVPIISSLIELSFIRWVAMASGAAFCFISSPLKPKLILRGAQDLSQLAKWTLRPGRTMVIGTGLSFLSASRHNWESSIEDNQCDFISTRWSDVQCECRLTIASTSISRNVENECCKRLVWRTSINVSNHHNEYISPWYAAYHHRHLQPIEELIFCLFGWQCRKVNSKPDMWKWWMGTSYRDKKKYQVPWMQDIIKPATDNTSISWRTNSSTGDRVRGWRLSRQPLYSMCQN